MKKSKGEIVSKDIAELLATMMQLSELGVAKVLGFVEGVRVCEELERRKEN